MMTSERWPHATDWSTAGLLLMLLLWQRIPVAESGCVTDVCFCFADGDIECAGIYLRRVPRFTRYCTSALLFRIRTKISMI